jgi:hypothetical protein
LIQINRHLVFSFTGRGQVFFLCSSLKGEKIRPTYSRSSVASISARPVSGSKCAVSGALARRRFRRNPERAPLSAEDTAFRNLFEE